MAKKDRKPITKKIRFEIFKRDGFRCAYCGRIPPEVTLEIDHVIPVAEGGPNNKDNYITSCRDCNAGKGKHSLSEVPESIAGRTKDLVEREAQYAAFKRVLKQKARRASEEIQQVEESFRESFPTKYFTVPFRRSVQHFNDKLTVLTVIENMRLACDRIRNPENVLKYFCGICWKQIRGEKAPWAWKN